MRPSRLGRALFLLLATRDVAILHRGLEMPRPEEEGEGREEGEEEKERGGKDKGPSRTTGQSPRHGPTR